MNKARALFNIGGGGGGGGGCVHHNVQTFPSMPFFFYGKGVFFTYLSFKMVPLLTQIFP